MLKYSKLITSKATIVFLILINNVAHIGSYAATNLATFNEDNQQNYENAKNIDNNVNIETHRLTKRMDLESCLGQFDVHKNTIIRTGESQAIGGKYLQGIELETMEECQRLCCETESCDVYIFESKKDGYCYLFECGTPENFHCKFTRHANYTSAVLTPVIRHMSEVTTPHPPVHLPHSITSNISQQEWELSNLKVKPEVREKPSELGLPTVGTSNTQTINNNKKSLITLANLDASLSTKVNSSVQCGRFQFACHSGECIAVYNACDGIPQCEDGSDEGPECPGASNNNPMTNSKVTPDVGVINKVVASPTQYQSALMQQSPQQQLQSMQQHAQAMVNNREDPNVWENRKIVSGSPQAGGNPESQNTNQIETQGDSFTSYVNNRGQQNTAPYGNGGVGGSTLEQSGLYMPHNQQEIGNNVYTPQQPQQPQQEQHILVPLPPPPPPAPLNSNWQQQAILNQQKQQQQQQQQQLLVNSPPLPEDSARYDLGENNNNNAAQQQNQGQLGTNVVQQPQLQQQPAQNQILTVAQQQQQKPQQQSDTVADNIVTSRQQTQLSKGKMADENILKSQDSEEYEDSEEKSTEPPKKHKHKKSKSKSKDLSKTALDLDDETLATKSHVNSAKSIKSAISPVHEQYEIIHQNMALEFRDHDGQSERPGGAVLSLTLGLLITAALAILIGCRMKTVGRRARRLGGKTPYSHEADFLVNGMYL